MLLWENTESRKFSLKFVGETDAARFYQEYMRPNKTNIYRLFARVHLQSVRKQYDHKYIIHDYHQALTFSIRML